MGVSGGSPASFWSIRPGSYRVQAERHASFHGLARVQQQRGSTNAPPRKGPMPVTHYPRQRRRPPKKAGGRALLPYPPGKAVASAGPWLPRAAMSLAGHRATSPGQIQPGRSRRQPASRLLSRPGAAWYDPALPLPGMRHEEPEGSQGKGTPGRLRWTRTCRRVERGRSPVVVRRAFVDQAIAPVRYGQYGGSLPAPDLEFPAYSPARNGGTPWMLSAS